MGRDWKHLADSVEAAREAKNLTQVALAEKAGVSESTIQNIESGKERTRVPASLHKVERALGWKPGSGERVLEGGAPEVEEATAPPPSGLPLRIVHELQDGPLLDATVLDLSPLGSDARMIVVVKGAPGASPEQIRADLLAWAKAQEHIQNLPNTDDQGKTPN
ncbi:multiprotein-bridging factor 1 family protein [Streptomyces sp. NPDC004330]|uniref:helix-turn-helix domain-containing protein n=1 Tax=Streptomyces sp. NPDC004330 TaxID=3364700 RepID=UPI0036959771